MSRFIDTKVLTPSPGPDTQLDKPWYSKKISIKYIRYAPKKFQKLCHNPGGIPEALKENKFLLLLVPFLLTSIFFAALREAKKADIIHSTWAVNGCIAGIAGWITKTPVLTTLRGSDIKRAAYSITDRLFLKVCLSLSERIIVVSQSIEGYIKDQYPEYRQKVKMIANGVSRDFFLINRDKQFEKRNTTFGLIFIGSLSANKDVATIVKAVSKIDASKNIRLSVFGEGPEKKRLIHLCQQLDISNKVKFFDFIAPDLIPFQLQHHDVFILSSHSEGRPNVVIEAMAAGLPVIATDIGGVNELVLNGQTGLLYKPGDSEQLADHILKLNKNPMLQKTMGVNGRKAVIDLDMTWDVTAGHYLNEYNHLLSRSVE